VIRHPVNALVAVGDSPSFQCSAVGETPLTYQWQRNGEAIPDATAPVYTGAARLEDNGARLSCQVTNKLGTTVSTEATLSVVDGERPVGVIVQPEEGMTYRAGDFITYSATATDVEDGDLPSTAFTWEVIFHHDVHTHPFMLPTTGTQEGSFNIPVRGETSGNVWYRIVLTVTDSTGLTHQTYRDIHPITSVVTLETEPPGLQVYLDNRPVTTPTEIIGVVGMMRKLTALPQVVDGQNWVFESWSSGEEADHFFMTPDENSTYRAVFTAQTP
jgi:hypothetical protein